MIRRQREPEDIVRMRQVVVAPNGALVLLPPGVRLDQTTPDVVMRIVSIDRERGVITTEQV